MKLRLPRLLGALGVLGLLAACDGGDTDARPTTMPLDATPSEDGASTVEPDGDPAADVAGPGDASDGDAVTADAGDGDAPTGDGDAPTGDGDATTTDADVDDPCADVECTAPPAPLCVTSAQLLVFTAPGVCHPDDGCAYGSQRVDCPDGCVDGACAGADPCAHVTCDAPPSGCRAATGTCDGGACSYAPIDGACDDDDPCTVDDTCSDGACAGTAKTCVAPPAPTCQDGSVLLVPAATGACDAGACAYPTTPVTCPSGCADGACRADPCKDVVCDAPPDACHAATGTCQDGVCGYAPLTTAAGTCDDADPCTDGDGCQAGTCRGAAVACDDPPAVACADDHTLAVPASIGTCDEGACGYDVTPVACPGGCFDGACNAPPVARITCPGTSIVDSALSFTGASSTDADGSVATYAYAFGDGASTAASAVPTAGHTFTAPGTYTVVLTATDDRGGADTASCEVVVTPYPSLVVSQSTTLCGEHRYDAFTVQGGAQVTCPTGDLRIKARTVFIDPASSIVLDAVVATAGASDFRLCDHYWGTDGRTGAPGAGHGTAGVKPADTAWRDQNSSYYYDYVCRSCPAPEAGPVRGSATILGIEGGLAGGDGCAYLTLSGGCRADDVQAGGLGGGALDLVATEKITVLGSISARGGDGARGNIVAAGAGGGSGGGVELVAPVVEVKGSIDVSGGLGVTTAGFDTECFGVKPTSGGDGGQGRVKLVWGTSLVKTGTITGAVLSEGRLPPLTLRSSTHPDEARWYADGFDAVEVAWDAPHAAVQGYWWAVTKAADFALTPANGTWTAEPRVSVPRAAFTSRGVWRVLVVATDTDGVASPIASAFTVRVETAPWAVTSATHPSQDAWYPQTSVALAFGSAFNDSAGLASSVRYRIDRKTTFDAAEAGWTETTSSQLVATTDAAGAALASFVYYVHVLPVDAMGRSAKQAGLYRLQLGTAPPRSSFFGYVTSGTGASIAGAKVRIEPFGLERTTDENGYFLFADQYEGRYAVSVKASGYLTLSAEVDLGPATVPWSAVLSQ